MAAHLTWKEVKTAMTPKAVIHMRNERGEPRSIGAASMSVKDVMKALRTFAEPAWTIERVEREG